MMVKPKTCMRNIAPIKRERDGDHRNDGRTHRTKEEKDDNDDDQERLAQGLDHLFDGVFDVGGAVIGDAGGEAVGQLLADRLHFRPHPLDHVQRVGVGQGPDAHEHRRLSGKSHLGVVILGPEHHLAHILDADDGALVFPDHQLFEIVHRPHVGVGGQIDLDHRALGLADGGQEVVGGQGLTHLHRADVEGGHAGGVEPDAHGKGPRPQHLGPLHALEGGKPRLDDANQIIGNLVLRQDIGGEAEIGRGELGVRRLDVDDGDFRLGRQIAAHLIDLGTDLGQGLDRIVVEPQAGADRRPALGTLRLEVIDTVGGGNGPFQRRGDEAAHQLGAGTGVDGGDRDHGVIAARILADIEGTDGLEPGNDDQQAGDHRQHRPLDKKIGEFHGSTVLGLGRQFEFRRERVVDHHALTVAQFEHPGADHGLLRRQP